MKSVRIYKDDIRVHVLRSLFFTDTVIALLGALGIGGILYFIFHYVLHSFSLGHFFSALLLTEIAFFALITQKVDNQAIYKIVPRGLTFKNNKKEFRYKDLDSYFTNFSIQDNLLIRKNSIVRIYRVDPFDIALLNNQDREHFFVKLKQMIHVLPSQVQFIVQKEGATTEDYSQHFFSLYDQANAKRETLIASYINELSEFIENHQLLLTRHYAVFSVSCNPNKTDEKVKAIKKLNDIGIRFASSLASCNIQTQVLDNEELISFAQDTLR